WLALLAGPGRDSNFPAANGIPTLREVAALASAWSPIVDNGGNNVQKPEGRDWLGELQPLVVQGAERATARMIAIDHLALQAAALASMDYDFLFDKVRRQLVIGYNVAEHRCDASYYDLLASEARLCNFVAIAQGQLPQESWFALGRLLTSAGGEPVLLAWSGSMFEYLMPLLVMPTYEHTLLDQTCAAAVERQIAYGRER